MSSILDLPSDGFVQNWTITAADVVKSYEVGGQDLGSRMMVVLEQTVARAARCDNTISATLRSQASSSSAASTPSGTVGGRTKMNSIRAVESWRNSEVKNLSAVNTLPLKRRVPDGLCYTKALRRTHVEDISMRTGEWPTFGAFVRLPAKAFRSLDELEKFRIIERATDVYHVAPGGQAGKSLLDAVAAYAGRVKLSTGTIGAVVASSRAVESPYVVVSGSARVGGLPVGGDAAASVGSKGVLYGVCLRAHADHVFDVATQMFGGDVRLERHDRDDKVVVVMSVYSGVLPTVVSEFCKLFATLTGPVLVRSVQPSMAVVTDVDALAVGCVGRSFSGLGTSAYQ